MMTDEERQRVEALIRADSILTLLWHRYSHRIPEEVRDEFKDTMDAVLKVSRRVR